MKNTMQVRRVLQQALDLGFRWRLEGENSSAVKGARGGVFRAHCEKKTLSSNRLKLPHVLSSRSSKRLILPRFLSSFLIPCDESSRGGVKFSSARYMHRHIRWKQVGGVVLTNYCFWFVLHVLTTSVFGDRSLMFTGIFSLVRLCLLYSLGSCVYVRAFIRPIYTLIHVFVQCPVNFDGMAPSRCNCIALGFSCRCLLGDFSRAHTVSTPEK